MKLEKLDDNRYELYTFDSNTAYWERDVAYDIFVRFDYLSYV